MIKNKQNKWIIYSVFAIIIFGIFFYMSYSTPLCGDDWAFYNNYIDRGILGSTYSMYMGWEGRLFTLFFTHAIISHKMLWNIINPLFYVIIYLCIMKIVNPKNKILSSILVLFFMLTIKDNVRMQTYTWITGSIYYVLPMVLSFIGLTVLLKYFNSECKLKWYEYILLVVPFIYVPLGMENIAFTMLFGLLFVIIYRIIKYKNWNVTLLITLGLMGISFVIWALCPGTSVRVESLGDWGSLTIIQKIIRNTKDVLSYTFIQNKYLIFVLSICIGIYNFVSKKVNKKLSIIFALIYLIAIIDLLAENVINRLSFLSFMNFMVDESSLFNIVFWLLYTVVLLTNAILLAIKDENNLLVMFFILLGACAASVLFMSPVIGPRLEIYTVYFLMVSVILMIDKMVNNKIIDVVFVVILIMICAYKGKILMDKYTAVRNIQTQRMAEIDNYHEYYYCYEGDTIWLERFPIFSVHSGDVEIDDTYHMEAFKKYHNIPSDMNVEFYWKEN